MIELGLQRISRLLAKTPLPWRAIHVAGTNGKGSICAYASAMLEVYNNSSYRVQHGQTKLKHARYTSPHLIDRWDCITINQKTVPFRLFDRIEKRVLKRNEQEGIAASEFELLTATAFEIFTHEDVDVGVVEVGMGGRLDATNVIGQPINTALSDETDPAIFRAPPLVTAISKIGLDHQAFLGNTLEEIAREKAGIIKSNVPVAWDDSNDVAVIRVLGEVAAANRVVTLDDPQMPSQFLRQGGKNSLLAHDFPGPVTKGLPAGGPVPMHQRLNLSVAFRSTWTALQELRRVPEQCDTLKGEDRRSTASLVSGMVLGAAYDTEAKLPGRLQWLDMMPLIGRKEPVLLDGAHNMQSAEALASYVSTHREQSQQKVTWVLAASNTKDVGEILSPLLRPGDSVFAVEFGPVDGMPWVQALAAEKLVQAAQGVVPDIDAQAYGGNVLAALKVASEIAAGGPMVIAGSLYLVGDVLRLLRDAGRTLPYNGPAY
ncbi:hypothetical protein LTR85_006899 [Meristemomyces frigidus]|nr:hypothetical protein LTR85_006899 [Meristemomyces frigidus]